MSSAWGAPKGSFLFDDVTSADVRVRAGEPDLLDHRGIFLERRHSPQRGFERPAMLVDCESVEVHVGYGGEFDIVESVLLPVEPPGKIKRDPKRSDGVENADQFDPQVSCGHARSR